MSTVMYCYKLKKSELWKFKDAVFQHYKNNGFGHKVVEQAHKKIIKDELDFWQALDDIETIKDEWLIDIQIFDMKSYYLLRPLEAGWFFMNTYQEFYPSLTMISYDDRTDIPPEDRKNKRIARLVDEKISTMHYLILPIITKTVLIDYFYTLAKTHKEKD